MMGGVAFTAYLSGSLLLLAARAGGGDDGAASWLSHDMQVAYLSDESLFAHGLRATYWALVTISTIGYGDIVPLTISETGCAMFIMLAGCSLFPAVIANMVELAKARNLKIVKYAQHLGALRYYMLEQQLPQDLQDRVFRHEQYQHTSRRGVNEEEVLQKLPLGIRLDVRHTSRTDHATIVSYGSLNCFIRLVQWFHMFRSIVSYGSLNCFIWLAQLFHMARSIVSSRLPRTMRSHVRLQPYAVTAVTVFLAAHGTCSRARGGVLRYSPFGLD